MMTDKDSSDAAKDVCSIVLASEREVLPRLNCWCEELQSTCDREHSRVLKLEAEIVKKQQMLAKSKNQNSPIQKQFVDLQVKFQNYKECLRNQKEKDDTIRHLHAEKDILGLLIVGSTESSIETKALETEIAQLKEGLTSLKIQNDGYKTYRNSYKTQSTCFRNVYQKFKVHSTTKRADWVQPNLLPKKKQVTFLKPHRTSPRCIQKPTVQHKKPTVPMNMFPKAKPATEARKPIPKRNTQNHNPIPAKSVKARRAADYYKNLYVGISQFVDRSTKSMHTKPHQEKRVVNTSTNAWNATKNTVARIVPIWKPTGRRFSLHDIFSSRMSTKPIVKPSELTPCVCSSTKIPMLSKFITVTLGMESWFQRNPCYV
nr:hypothetical protein [Tanacetum cinerariifolium]